MCRYSEEGLNDGEGAKKWRVGSPICSAEVSFNAGGHVTNVLSSISRWLLSFHFPRAIFYKTQPIIASHLSQAGIIDISRPRCFNYSGICKSIYFDARTIRRLSSKFSLSDTKSTPRAASNINRGG